MVERRGRVGPLLAVRMDIALACVLCPRSGLAARCPRRAAHGGSSAGPGVGLGLLRRWGRPRLCRASSSASLPPERLPTPGDGADGGRLAEADPRFRLPSLLPSALAIRHVQDPRTARPGTRPRLAPSPRPGPKQLLDAAAFPAPRAAPRALRQKLLVWSQLFSGMILPDG